MTVAVEPLSARHSDVRDRDAGQDEPIKRHRLRLLDACLGQLEDAQESGKHAVPMDVAAAFGAYVTGLVPSMPLDRALELVFAEQAKWLTPPRPRLQVYERGPAAEAISAPPLPSLAVAPLTENEARALTDRIRSNLHEMCLLLQRAHEGKAWSVLGYRTWEAYVSQEFSLSRSHSYELLDQARIILAVQEAAALPETPIISARRAARMKPHLGPIVDALRAMPSSGTSLSHVLSVIDGVLATKQQGASAARMPDEEKVGIQEPGACRSANSGPSSPAQCLTLGHMIRYLAELPSAAVIVQQLPVSNLPSHSVIERASAWLTELAVEVKSRQAM